MIDDLKKEVEILFNHDVFHFNKKRNKYDYFPDYLKSLFDEYDALLNNKKFWKAFCSVHYPNNPETADDYHLFTKMISDLSKKLKECLDAYYLAKVSLAYNSLTTGLNEYINFIRSALFDKAFLSFPTDTFVGYRIRHKPDNLEEEVSRGKMFHIPFELREKVMTQRFSIPGHPSLYIGDTSYVCWVELTEPKINNVYVSKISNSDNIKLIEILSLTELKEKLSVIVNPTDYSSELFRFLLTYPLNIACSIKTKNRKATFKSEYIVPQLFLQYIMEYLPEIDGIKYYSTRVDADKLEKVGFNNFVFPTRTSKVSGYCEILNGKFKLTEPLVWEYEEINRGNVTYYGSTPRRGINIELIKGRKFPYDNTTFKAIENVLNDGSMKLDKAF